VDVTRTCMRSGGGAPSRACMRSGGGAPSRGGQLHGPEPEPSSPPGGYSPARASPGRGTGDHFTGASSGGSPEVAATSSARAASAASSTSARSATPERLRNVLDLYPPETLCTINPIRTTHARGRGRGGCLLTEEPTKFEEANTEEC
jgi:hypothetical protein